MMDTMFGVLPVNKTAGRTSRDVCNRVERLVRPNKVGHTGTLDPMATGVLLLALGSASRLVEFSLGHNKQYEADFLLGHSSDTLDSEGAVAVLNAPPIPSRLEIEREKAKWLGVVSQVPPKYSAINVGGKRAYNLARKGKEFELPAREISISAIEVLAYEYPLLTLRITCGSGTYVRSLGSDIAIGLGSNAIMSRLVRTRVGPFELSHCVELDELTSVAVVAQKVHAPQHLIANMPFVTLDHQQAAQLRQGVPVQLREQTADRLAVVDRFDNLVAVIRRCTHEDGRFGNTENLYRSLRVFHENSETSQPKTMSTPHSPES